MDTVQRARLHGREGPSDGCQQDGPRGRAPGGPEGGHVSPPARTLAAGRGRGEVERARKARLLQAWNHPVD